MILIDTKQKGVVVLCDANVIYKSMLRDLIMRLGEIGVFYPRWTDKIHEEWIRNLSAHRPGKLSSLHRVRDLMNLTLPDALITVTTNGNHNLPDLDDQHVLDAAISAGASVLLTFNLSDFPQGALPDHLKVGHPDAFLLTCLEQQQDQVLRALQELRADLKNPPFTPDELLAAMRRAELPAFAAGLEAFKDRI